MTAPDIPTLIRTLAYRTRADQDRRPTATDLIDAWIADDRHLSVLPDDPVAIRFRERTAL